MTNQYVPDLDNVLEASIASSNERFPKCPFGHQHIIIAIEEFSELTKELTKQLRGKLRRRTHLVDEMADAALAMEYLKKIFKVSDDELQKAIAMKALRLKDTLSVYGHYD